MTLWKRENYRESKKISGWQGLGRGMNRWSTGDFQSSETTLYNTVMMNICHHAFAKIHGVFFCNIEWNLMQTMNLVNNI